MKIQKFSAFRLWLTGFIGLITLTLQGCIAFPAIDNYTQALDTSKGAYVFMTIEFENAYRSGYPAYTVGIRHTKASPDNNNAHISDAEDVGESSSKSVIRAQLLPGKYTAEALLAYTYNGLITAFLEFDIDMTYEVLDSKTAPLQYLGHLYVKNIERTNDTEQRSGPVYPVLQQAAAGFLDGTLQVIATDEFDYDTAGYAKTFPLLKDQTFTKIVPKEILLKRRGHLLDEPLRVPFIRPLFPKP